MERDKDIDRKTKKERKTDEIGANGNNRDLTPNICVLVIDNGKINVNI